MRRSYDGRSTTRIYNPRPGCEQQRIAYGRHVVHHVERHANNPIEADHGRLKHRLRAMRGLGSDRTPK
jgi:hypothetical protein